MCFGAMLDYISQKYVEMTGGGAAGGFMPYSIVPAVIKEIADVEGALTFTLSMFQFPGAMGITGSREDFEIKTTHILNLGAGEKGFAQFQMFKDEPVLVALLHGCLAAPVILGPYTTKTTVPKEVCDTAENYAKFPFIVRDGIDAASAKHEISMSLEKDKEGIFLRTNKDTGGGHVWIMDKNRTLLISNDEEGENGMMFLGGDAGEWQVQVKKKVTFAFGKCTVTIDCESGDVAFKTEGALSVEANEVSVKSAQSDVTVESTGALSLKATKDVVIEATANCNLKGTAGLKAEGAKVDMSSQGPFAIKGMPVQLG